MKRYNMFIFLFFIGCLNASASTIGIELLSRAKILNFSTYSFQNQPHDLEEVEIRRLLESLKANPPYYSIDVSYTKQKVVPSDIFQRKIDGLKKKAQELSEKHQNRWRNLEVRSPGFFNSENERVILSRERVRIEGLKRIRTDLTFFDGDSESSPKTREIVNIYHEGKFCFINKTERRIEIYDKPQFRGSSGVEMLSSGRVSGHLGIYSDIIYAVDPNSQSSIKGINKKRYRHIGFLTLNGKLTKRLECVNAIDGKKEYELFLDSVNWGKCYKIAWHSKETGDMSKTIEFGDFRVLEQTDKFYPHTIVQRKFNKEGKEYERQELIVSHVVTNLTIPVEIFDINGVEFTDFEIVDYRISSP